MRGLALALMLLAGAAQAGPDQSPRPMSRPDEASLRPLPRPGGVQLAALPPARVTQPALRKAALCGIEGLAGRKIAPITSRIPGCGLEDGVEVTHVSGIPLSIPAQVDCGTAAALKRWVDRGILPAVGNRGGGVARLEIAGSYACRPRNNQSGGKVSEHGRGHALDLAGLKLRSGEVITVAQGWRSRNGAVLHRIHASACGTFGTVLGPEADRFHQDHIHVDTAQNRGGAYCR
ncbi:extensin family protein [Paenirhodobacter sp.]|uniref:extensin-like domain-containing protein n=1 Tax=Paenirhodobacter sp. TaxID=1965326 RepID=UPI003B4165B2